MAIGERHKDPDALAITTIRTLCMDAVEAAKSGHPGTPMAMAPVAYTLWQRFLRFDPTTWSGRIGTVSCSPQDMVRCFCTVCFI